MGGAFQAEKDCPTIKRATRAFVDVMLSDLLDPLRLAARGSGYALAVHGSLSRDVDLIAVPWADSADEPQFLVQRLCGVLSGFVGRAITIGSWSDKPHGRKACTIILPGNCPEIDLSIMPRCPKGDA